jgi:hypothetical protein
MVQTCNGYTSVSVHCIIGLFQRCKGQPRKVEVGAWYACTINHGRPILEWDPLAITVVLAALGSVLEPVSCFGSLHSLECFLDEALAR